MKDTEKRFLNGRDRDSLIDRLHQLSGQLEAKVESLQSMEDPAAGISISDREMLQKYVLRLQRGLHGDIEQDLESNIADAEIVCETVRNVYTDSYIQSNYPRSESMAVFKEIIAGFADIQEGIGKYEQRTYHPLPLQREQVFRNIMQHIMTKDLKRYHDAIFSDEKNFGDEFRRNIRTVYAILREGIPAIGRLRLAYIHTTLKAPPYDENHVARLFNRNPIARDKAEHFLIAFRLMQTVGNRYYEYRTNPG